MLSSLTLALAPLFQSPAESAPAAAATHDLSCGVEVGTPVLVTSKFKLKGKLDVRKDGGSVVVPVDSVETIEHVDVYESVDQPSAGDFAVRRTYVKYFVDDSKRCKDPEWNGVALTLTKRSDQVHATLDGRMARARQVDKEWRSALQAGAWLSLPRAVAVGAAVEVDARALAILMHLDDSLAKGSAQLRLTGVDAAGVATIAGTLALDVTADDAPLVAEHVGPCTLVVDTTRHRLVELRWDGEAVAHGIDATLSAGGKLHYEALVSVAYGEAAAKALERPPVYRECDRNFAPARLEFGLPSYWFEFGDGKDPRKVMYRSSLSAQDAPHLIELKVLEVARAQHVALMDAAMKTLREDKERRVLEERTESCALGKGKLARFLFGEEEQWMAFFPCGDDAIVRIHLFAPPGDKKVLPGVWSKLKASLKRAK